MANGTAPHLLPAPPLRWFAATDIGKIRDENQDSFVVEPEAGIFLVADGMGGHRGGAVAANIVAEDLPVMIETGLAGLKSRRIRSIRNLLKKTIIELNRQVKMEGHSEAGHKGMGTTLAAALLHDRRAYIANLGDSRAYRLRKGRLTQLTKDHSVVGELIGKGTIRPEDAQAHEAADQITHYVGMEEQVTPHIRTFALQKADRLLLCTDGLTDLISDHEILGVIGDGDDPENLCRQLIVMANGKGGNDNITVSLILVSNLQGKGRSNFKGLFSRSRK